MKRVVLPKRKSVSKDNSPSSDGTGPVREFTPKRVAMKEKSERDTGVEATASAEVARTEIQKLQVRALSNLRGDFAFQT